MLVLKKVTLKEFANEFNTFCESDKRNLLVRGYDNWDKFICTLKMLSQKQIKETVLLETYVIRNLKDIFEVNGLSKSIVHTGKIGVVNGIKLLFDRYTTTNNLYANNKYAIFYPIEAVLYNSNDLKKLSNKVKSLRTKHNIFITTNDYSNRIDKLYDYIDIDETLILDLSEYHPEKYRTIKNNFQREGKELPY